MHHPIRHSPRRNLFRLTLGCWLLLAGGAAVDASSWRSELYPENWQRPDPSVAFYTDKLIQDFSYAGYRRGEEDIPVVTGPVFDVTPYGADPTGASDSTVAIQNAINAAAGAGGGVVYLPAGTFRISPQGTNAYCLRIAASNVVLRGAGTAATFLLNTSYVMRNKSVVLISPASTSNGTAVNITADLPGPARRIPVASAAAFAPGNFVRIEWTFTDAWIAEHAQQTWWSEAAGPDPARYYREVLAVNTSEGWIEVDVPTRYSIKTRDNARVSRQNGLLAGVGVESLSIGNLQHPGTGFAENDYLVEGTAAYDTHNSWLIRMDLARDSWISGVHSFREAANTTTAHMLSNGLSLGNCFRVTVRDCAMRRPQYGGGGGNGYMYRIIRGNECLLENCVAEFSRHGFVVSHAGTSGNVFLGCEDRETARATGATGSYTTGGSGSDNHMHFSHSNLWDSCHVHNSFWTAHHRLNNGTIPHGLTSAHGVYWNTSGSGTRGGDIVRSEQARYGYVIGTSGSRFSASNPTGGNTAPADHLEGIGLGATLEPASLYLDQLARRLEPTVTYRGNGATSGTAPVDANSPYPPGAMVTVLGAGDLARSYFAFSDWNTAADGSGTGYAPGSTFWITGSTILYAQWDYLMQVDAGPDQTVALGGSSIPWTPVQIPAAAWYDAADPGALTQSGGAVSQWNDKSGYANHAAQAEASNRPTTGLATIGGLATVSFRVAQQQHLSAADSASLKLDSSGGANLFAVFKYLGYVNQSSALNVPFSKGQILSAEAAYGIRVGSGNALSYKPGIGVQLDGGSGFLGQSILYSGTRNDNTKTSALHLNGELGATVTSGTVITSDNASPLLIGRDPASSRFADVDFGEILVVGGALSAEDRQQIEGYLAHKWALAADLPAGHPYKAAAPVVDAGTVTLNGLVTGSIGEFLTHAWSVESGPAAVLFADPSALSTTATFTRKGVYVLRLTSHDSIGASYDEVTVTVDDAPPPSAFEIWAGGGEVTFDGDANGDGVPDGVAWLLGAGDPSENANPLLPAGVVNNGAFEIFFTMLNQARRDSAVMKLQYSPDLEAWTTVTVPDESGTHAGVEFSIVPDGDLNEVRALVPMSPPGAGGKVFVRLTGELVETP